MPMFSGAAHEPACSWPLEVGQGDEHVRVHHHTADLGGAGALQAVGQDSALSRFDVAGVHSSSPSRKGLLLILLDGLVDAAVRKGPGGSAPPVQLHQLAHLGVQAVEKIRLSTWSYSWMRSFSRVEFIFLDPVSYVYQIQQIPELLFRQFDLHGADTSQIDDTVTIIAETYAEFHIKNRAKRLKSVLRQKAPHSIICNPDAK